MSVLSICTLARHHGCMRPIDSDPLTVRWLSAHPEKRSLNGSLRSDGVAHLRRVGHTVLESDLYAMDWDPVVRARDGGIASDDETTVFRVSADTRRAHRADGQPPEVVHEQAKLRQADAVVVQFPLWWYGMPAILKGWFDRVFVSGFAFGIDPATGRRLDSSRARSRARAHSW